MVVDTPNISKKSAKINCLYKTTLVTYWMAKIILSWAPGLLDDRGR